VKACIARLARNLKEARSLDAVVREVPSGNAAACAGTGSSL
jgi:hypothetical protein